MPGILGVVAPELEQKNIASIMRSLLHHDSYQQAQEQLLGAALGVINLGTIATAARGLLRHEDRYLLAFAGELYNAQEPGHALAPEKPATKAEHPELALRAFLRWGAAAFARLNGVFQIAI